MQKIMLTCSVVLLAMFSISAANLQLTVRLKNGDVVTGKSTLPKVTFVTTYGTLSIPVEKINSIKFGIFSDKTKDGAVLPDLNKLQSITNDNEAKTVYERLLAYGSPILSSVKTFTENPFYKISDRENYTVEQLLDELYKKANLTYGQSVNDMVTFDGSNTLEGSISVGDIQLQSEYGNLSLKRDKIESIDISVIDESVILGNGNFVLKANYHISGNDTKGWVNTSVSVKPGDKFSISATGKIILKSLSGGAYNPDGYVSGTKDGAYTDDMSTKYGSVIYRIGEYGEIKQAGTKLDATADTEGVVYISIYETVYDKGNSGSYAVKVTKK
jgi:hypothetical protein